jgi:phage recombination protein Bet
MSQDSTYLVPSHPSEVTDHFSRDEIDLIKSQLCNNLTDYELKFFLAKAQRIDLDPFNGEIIATKRKDHGVDKLVTVITYTGYLRIAGRNPQFDGIDGPEFAGEDGVWTDCWTAWDIEKKPPLMARCRAHRKDRSHASWAIVRFEARAQRYRDGNLQNFWATDPVGQIGKCALVQALRFAGLTCPDETCVIDTSGETTSVPTASIASEEDFPALAPPRPQRVDGKGGPGHADLMAVLTKKLSVANTMNDIAFVEEAWENELGKEGGIRIDGTSHHALWKLYLQALSRIGQDDQWLRSLKPSDGENPSEQGEPKGDEVIDVELDERSEPTPTEDVLPDDWKQTLAGMLEDLASQEDRVSIKANIKIVEEFLAYLQSHGKLTESNSSGRRKVEDCLQSAYGRLNYLNEVLSIDKDDDSDDPEEYDLDNEGN